MKTYKLFFYLILSLLSIPQFSYRFKYPEKSETELFLDFFKAYKEWFYAMDQR